MFRMVVGHSNEVDAGEAAASVLAQCEVDLGGATPSAGLLFCAYETDPEIVVAAVATAYPGIQLIGSSTMGEMSSGMGYLEDSVALALFVTDSVDIRAGLGTNVSQDHEAAVRAAVQEARSGSALEPVLCITTPSVAGLPPQILEALRTELGDEVSIIGGGAISGTLGPPAAIGAKEFFNGRVLEDAVPVLLFSGPLVHSFGVDAGWQPVGKIGVVTMSAHDTVSEIDGESALAFYERYLGAGGVPSSATPLAVHEGDGEGFFLRVALLSEDLPLGVLRVPGGLQEGARVQLAVAATEAIFDGTHSAFRRAIKAFPEGSTPGAALLFACAVRKAVLGTRAGRELEIARTEFGDLPIAGAYCLGEIAPLDAGAPTRFHNETMVAVLLGSE